MEVLNWSFRELNDGVPVVDENGNTLGNSTEAAKSGILAVLVSRVGMASPGMGNEIIVKFLSQLRSIKCS